MMFLVRKLRSLPALRRFKVVLVTDRKDLQDQLSDTAALTGETVKVAKSVDKVKQYLAEKGPALVFAMIQKYAERDAAPSEDESDAAGGIDAGTFPVLNDDESILVMVDEAHRSHSSALHSSLLNALPNCARIGFTGTPIIMGAKKRTHEIFGEFLDRYTIKESEADGATVPILYEGRTAEGAVADGRDLDQLFEDMFSDRPANELEAIKRKYATKGHVLEAPKLIAAKARDILRHYVENILPNGLKAQVVAYSRLAAIRYTAALAQARDELVAEAEALEPRLRDLDDAALESKPRKVRVAARAWRSLPMLRQIEFATIISGSNDDDPAWKEWTESPKVKARIARFKKPLGEPTREDRSARVPRREVDAADRLRRTGRGRHVPRSADPGGRASAGDRAREPHRPRQEGGHRRGLLRDRAAPQGGAERVQQRTTSTVPSAASRTRFRSCATGTTA